MPDRTDVLGSHLTAERSEAARHLLRRPLLDASADAEGFRLAARHRQWLADWFESTCGWTVHVDVASGYARLLKRAPTVYVSRPLRRTRGAGTSFDRRRYELLCRVAAELVRHPVTTVGLLATAIAPEAGLDSAKRS